MEYIFYKGNCYTELHIHFSPALLGSDFFKILELIDFPVKESDSIIIKYAITELVTNSVRALRERAVTKEVRVDLKISGNFLKIVVTDAAGGFDPARLPFDINSELKKPDFTARRFQEYGERHGFNRFGIGLISAKMAFDAFHLVFIDEDGREAPWRGEGSVSGTRITAAKRLSTAEKAAEEKASRAETFVRRNERHSIFTKAVVNQSIEGYLIDISKDGLKLLLFHCDGLVRGGIIGVTVDAAGGIEERLVFRAVVRWIESEKDFWQIGSEFVKDDSFPAEAVDRLAEAVSDAPQRLGGLVVIEGT